MKKGILHIALSFFLLINILFSQTVLSFFHTHDERDHIVHVLKKSGLDMPVLTKHVPECKICSCDLLHDLFYKESIRLDLSDEAKIEYLSILSDLYNRIPSFHQGRAPPSLLL